MHYEAIDELPEALGETQYYEENPKRVVNPVDSPDVGMQFSLNPYQGCEHGCVYCYARPTHEYWGWSAGVDFERRIIVKRNAPELLKGLFQSKSWQPAVIALSGNTDCYQPIERKLGITRRLLEVFLAHRNPVGILTKNALVLRDLGLLRELAAMNLVRVGMSVTSLDEDLRRRLEPRTVTAKTRLMTLEKLATAGVPTFAMAAPIIPGLNSHEIPALVEALANAGVSRVGHTIVRLNGPNAEIFRTWLQTHYPDRAQKIWHAIEQCHGGQVNDSRIGTRMGGEGPVAEQIHQLFTIAKRKHLAGRELPAYDFTHFRRRPDVPTLF
jgi:DNA repair photolyase